jgi:hypothetical protein
VSTSEWQPTMNLRHILEWEDDGTKLVLQQEWARDVYLEDYGTGVGETETEWREIPLWRLNRTTGQWEPRK